MVGTDPAVRGPKLLISNRCRFFTLRDLYNIFRHDKTSMYFAHTLMSSITWRFPHEKLYKEKLHFSLDYKAKMQLPTCPPGKKDASRRRQARKRLAATGIRCEGVYNRAGEPSVTFCGRGGMTERYEKSPALRLGFLNGAQSIPTWCG